MAFIIVTRGSLPDRPIQFVEGTPYLTADLVREFDRLLPNSELHLIANAGHYVQLDNPEAVAKEVLAPWPGE